MPGYLLLRNNKETGPFTLEQLIAHNLKQYDLVWIEGKSAGWRYPGEIEELKPYAPQPTEQPYDRFYKKQPAQAQPVAVPVFNKHDLPEPALTTKKRVVVTLPSQLVASEPMVEKVSSIKATIEKVETLPTSSSITQSEYTRSVEPVEMPRQIVPVLLEEKYSMPLNDIKKLYVENLLQKSNAKKSGKIGALKNVGMLMGVAVFFVLIIAAGYFLSHGKNNVHQNSKTPVTVADKSAEATTEDSDEQGIADEIMANTSAKNAAAVAVKGAKKQSSSKKAETSTTSSIASPKTTVVANGKAAVALPVKKQEQAHNDPVLPTAQHERVRKAEENNEMVIVPASQEKPEEKTVVNTVATNESEKQWTKKKIRKMVVVNEPVYKTGLLGGIRQVSLSVTNHTKYTMDMVVVELDYLKNNDNVVKTEKLYFKNIAPDATVNLTAPSSPQGTKLDYRMTLIVSNSLQYYYAAGN